MDKGRLEVHTRKGVRQRPNSPHFLSEAVLNFVPAELHVNTAEPEAACAGCAGQRARAIGHKQA